jgi:hypothetical protein
MFSALPVFPLKYAGISYLSHACYMSLPLSIVDLITLIISVKKMDMKCFICSFQLPVAFLSL